MTSNEPTAGSASSTLHLFPRNVAPTTGEQYLSDNMLVNTEIIATFKQFEQEPLSTTFRPYIKHLPGDFHISKKGNVSQSGSLKHVVFTQPSPSLSPSQPSSEGSQPPQPPISFQSLNFLQLESAFTLQDGGYIKHKKKKNRNSNDPNNPIDLDAHKKKRKKDPNSGEPKKKRKKTHKEAKAEIKETKA